MRSLTTFRLSAPLGGHTFLDDGSEGFRLRLSRSEVSDRARAGAGRVVGATVRATDAKLVSLLLLPSATRRWQTACGPAEAKARARDMAEGLGGGAVAVGRRPDARPRRRSRRSTTMDAYCRQWPRRLAPINSYAGFN